MFTEQTGPQQAGSPAIERWSAYLKELHARIAHRHKDALEPIHGIPQDADTGWGRQEFKEGGRLPKVRPS